MCSKLHRNKRKQNAMSNLAQVSQRILENSRNVQQSGQTGALQTLDGPKAEVKARLRALLTTGGDAQGQRGENQTGLQRGATGAAATMNVPPEVPAKLAEECVAQRLPLSVQSWLSDMVWVQKVGPSVGMKVQYPVLKPETRTAILSEMAVLDVILQPAHVERGAELTVEVTSFLAMYPFGLRNDPGLMQAKVSGWVSELENYPMYAVKKALHWWKRYGEKEPSFAEVLADVKLFCGNEVMQRRELLQNVLRGGERG